MPSFQNPIARPQLPFRHEGSNLRHLRDGDSIGREWQKASKDNSVLRANGEALNRLQRTVAGLRKPKFVMDRWHPFKIYNVPPNLCANAADSWRTFRVRAGLVGWRSPFKTPSYASTTYEELLDVSVGSDGIGLSIAFGGYGNPPNGFQDQNILSYTQGGYQTVTVPDTGTTGVTGTSYSEFVLDSNTDNNGERWAEFWIEIPDTNNDATHDQEIFPVIKCRMFQYGAGTRPSQNLTPPPDTIPIGIVCVRKGDDVPILNDPEIGYRIEQYLYDHAIRRYPLGYYLPTGMNIFSAGGMVFRGDWDDDSLSTSTFYPGDVVSKHGDAGGGLTYNELWVYNYYPDQSPAAPAIGGGNPWRRIMYSKF